MKIKLPILILGIVVCVFLFGQNIPIEVVSFFYTISTVVKDIIAFFIPIVVFTFIAYLLADLHEGTFLFVFRLFGAIVLSNILVTIYAYGIFELFYPVLDVGKSDLCIEKLVSKIEPLFKIPFSPPIKSSHALVAGVIFGVLFAMSPSQRVFLALEKVRNKCLMVLKKWLVSLIPIMIVGYLMKMQKDDILEALILAYGKIFAFILIAMLVYVYGMYVVAAQFRFGAALKKMQTFFASAMTAFSTMSSIVAYPITVENALRYSKNPKLTQGILSSSTNIHLMGVGISIPILSMTVLSNFGCAIPDAVTFLKFAFFLVLAKFSVAAVPGGSMMVVLPVLQEHLGFSPEMLALILSLYMLFDPFSAATNVLGNGAFSIFMTRVLDKKKK